MESPTGTFEDIVRFIGEFSHDPLGFVYAAFPWGQRGTELESMDGPDEWQKEILADIGRGVKDLSSVTREAVASGHGIGKAQDVDAMIDTPQGRRRFGDLRVDDYVFGGDGNPVRVIGRMPYTKIPFYRVHFDDDSFVDVSSGHMWDARSRNDRRRGRGYRSVSTLDIIREGVLRKNGTSRARQWEIPIQGAAQYPAQEVYVDPYIMGVWIGDGCRGRAGYCKPYTEVEDRIRARGYKTKRARYGCDVYIQGIRSDLRKYPVFFCRSYDRYVPDAYKYNTVEVRREVLCGLLDTDGEINKHASILYATTSRRLAEDVLWLVRSLGGKAQLHPTVKEGWYYKDGVRKACRDCYRVSMTLPFNPFTVEHKRVRYKADIEQRYRVRWIDRIESIGLRDAMCITVANDDGRYLANDFIVTHNSALVAWIILWSLATHEDTRCVVTANTDTQLRSKTWAELAKWYRLFIGRDMFCFTATSLFSAQRGHDKTWRADAIPWSRDNPEAFAGLHNQGKRILVIFDEASAIFDEIWTVTEGAMTDRDTEIIWCVFGNPTRNQGRFFECFHRNRAIWNCKQIDSRNVRISNKQQLNQWAQEYGEDSDFFRIRVKGEFPSQSENQLISRELAEAARRRVVETRSYEFAPVVIGVDPAWTGEDMLAVVLRQGLYSKVLEVTPRNDNDMEAARRIMRYQDDYRADAVHIDMGYGTGVYSAGKDSGRSNWRLVSFAERSDAPQYANKRAEMWGEMKIWLMDGGAIDDDRLVQELMAPESRINSAGKQLLESKDEMRRRGLSSPNIADALALTFAYPVRLTDNTKYREARRRGKIRKAGSM